MISSSYFSWDLLDRDEAPCVRDDAVELSYRGFAEAVDAAAGALHRRGIRAGDVVATLLPNRVELLVVLQAAWRLGAIGTPVNPAFTATEAEYQLTDAVARIVVVDDTTAATRPEVAGCAVIDVNDLSSTDDLSATGSLPADLGGPADDAADVDALLIYTSGSTGRPKGVRLTHANLRHMATAMVTLLDLRSDDHALLILPLFHVNAICVSFLAPMLAGGQLSITGKFSVSRFFDDVARLRPTYFSAVPTIYALLASHNDVAEKSLGSLRFAICGAAPISKELLGRVENLFGIPILEGYGLTEGTCASACNPRHGVRKLGTVGPAVPGQQIAIVDPDGTDLRPGEVGEVVITGPNVMRGYLNRPEATEATIVGGRLHTGDVGSLDADGYLTLVDRIKDMIIRGGENLYPKEIENALATHGDVLECAVVGAPDEVYGEVPIAFVVAYPDREISADDLAHHLESRLTAVKRPAVIHVVEALPRNPVGKVDKPGLRARLSTPSPA
ncbi:class I adenylate-forming enzyme family protein [Gordonia sp. NPDC003950]